MQNNDLKAIFKIEELEERLEMFRVVVFGLIIYDNGDWFPQFN